MKPNNELYNLRVFPFWVFNPVLTHYKYLFTNTLYATWLMNTLIVSIASTAISLLFGILAGYALARLRFWGAGVLGVAIFVSYLVPQTLLFIPMFDVIKTLEHRRHLLGADPDLPDVPDPVLHRAADGLLQEHPA